MPSCEENPWEAILTNVVGTHNLIEAAKRNRVEKVVNLSADKAVYSTSVYGTTKFLSERLAVEASQRGPSCFINVRYSNVFDSRGAVFEVFLNKLSEGEVISVLDPRMTRFFLTQDQVVSLSLFVLENAVGGETYIRLAPPVNILKLAETMVRVLGKGSIQILQDQARPGEKLDALLLSREESKSTYQWKDVFIINSLSRPLPLEGLAPVEEKDYSVDDFMPMSDEELEMLVQGGVKTMRVLILGVIWYARPQGLSSVSRDGSGGIWSDAKAQGPLRALFPL